MIIALLIINTILVFAFSITLLSGIIEVCYNLKYKKLTLPSTWIVPSIFICLIYFINKFL